MLLIRVYSRKERFFWTETKFRYTSARFSKEQRPGFQILVFRRSPVTGFPESRDWFSREQKQVYQRAETDFPESRDRFSREQRPGFQRSLTRFLETKRGFKRSCRGFTTGHEDQFYRARSIKISQTTSR